MAKFTPVDLDGLFNLTPETMSPPWDSKLPSLAGALPAERQAFWGIPFALGTLEGPRWIGLRGVEEVAVPVAGSATYVVLAHFCNTSHPPYEFRESFPPGVVVQPGEHLADYVLVYRDGTEAGEAIRRRFEINGCYTAAGADQAFMALPSQMPRTIDWRGPCPRNRWGAWQQSVEGGGATGTVYWVYALPNPHPEKELASLVL